MRARLRVIRMSHLLSGATLRGIASTLCNLLFNHLSPRPGRRQEGSGVDDPSGLACLSWCCCLCSMGGSRSALRRSRGVVGRGVCTRRRSRGCRIQAPGRGLPPTAQVRRTSLRQDVAGCVEGSGPPAPPRCRRATLSRRGCLEGVGAATLRHRAPAATFHTRGAPGSKRRRRACAQHGEEKQAARHYVPAHRGLPERRPRDGSESSARRRP